MGEGGLVVEEDEGCWEGEGEGGGVIRGGRGVVGGFEEVEHFRAFYGLRFEVERKCWKKNGWRYAGCCLTALLPCCLRCECISASFRPVRAMFQRHANCYLLLHSLVLSFWI